MTRPTIRAHHPSFASLVTALGLLLGSACGEGPAPPLAEPDAGPACELGARNCACIGGARCSDDLLCIAGRCSARSEPEPELMGPPPRPRPTAPDPADPDPDAGPLPPQPVDASLPPVDPEPDAGDDAG
jgi:hypothetical protein